VARAAARQISFSDIELMRQGVRLEPLLEAISKFLDRQPEMIERVRRDLVRGLKKPRTGRRGLTAPQVLRSLVLMRLKNWDYRELRERIADGLTNGRTLIDVESLRKYADSLPLAKVAPPRKRSPRRMR
jgi:IS5 family transposase